MKAIETTYSGIRFRSKTEAKWALFMDIIGCKWIYEPEGYDLGDGIFYCPDFYLPDVDAFLEIKPITGGFPSPTKQLAAQSGKRVVTMLGEPFFYQRDEDAGICHQLGLQNYGENWCSPDECGEDYGYAFCVCPSCGSIDIEWRGRGRRMKCGCATVECRSNYDYSRHPRIVYAVTETKSAFRWKK
jgi:hypothetical protein